jgi:hypothetical protein
MAWPLNNSERKLFFQETCAIIAPHRGLGLKARNFGDFSLIRGDKILFWIAAAKAAV